MQTRALPVSMREHTCTPSLGFLPLHTLHFHLPLEMWVLLVCTCPCSSPQPAGGHAGVKLLTKSLGHTEAWVPMHAPHPNPSSSVQVACCGPWQGCNPAPNGAIQSSGCCSFHSKVSPPVNSFLCFFSTSFPAEPFFVSVSLKFPVYP